MAESRGGARGDDGDLDDDHSGTPLPIPSLMDFPLADDYDDDPELLFRSLLLYPTQGAAQWLCFMSAIANGLQTQK